MDNAKQHWPILRKLGTDLENKVREFMVIGRDGNGVIVATKDGMGYWIGEMEYGSSKSKTVIIPTPLDVPDLVSMAQGDDHILLLNKRGQIYSMGKNDKGQLGLGSVDQDIHFSPQLISSQCKFTSVRCGVGHNLALTEDGKVWAWGENRCGQVEENSSTDFLPSPRQISKLDHHQVVAVECGQWHSLALTDQGVVYAWGWNQYGQLGDGSKSSKHTLTRIPTLSPVQSMAAGSDHTLLLTQTGEVYACGWNGNGQLGLPTTTKSSLCLSKVAGLPLISQIASHPLTDLSIAISPDHRCFVWGELADGTSQSTPRELPPEYSTVESPLSFYSTNRSTPHSVSIPARECSSKTDSTMRTESRHDSVPNQTPPNPILDQMFNNPDSYPDVRFQVGDQTILAHRNILRTSSVHFRRLFSSPTNYPNLSSSVASQSGPSSSRHTTNPSKPKSGPSSSRHTTNPSEPESGPSSPRHTTNPSEPESGPSSPRHTTNPSEPESGPSSPRHTTNPSEPESGPSSPRHTTNPSEPESGPSSPRHITNLSKPDSTTHFNQVTISIPDHSYPAFHAYLRFLYLGILEMSPEFLADLFSLSVAYLESDLQQLCISRMRTTLTPATCCLYYPLTHRHSIPELSAFQQELVQFISTRTTEVYRTATYQSMDSDLCKKLTISMANLPSN